MSPTTVTPAPKYPQALTSLRSLEESTVVAQCEAKPKNGVSRLVVVAGLLTIAFVFSARCLQIAWNDSITVDETTHLMRSLYFWQCGDDVEMWSLGTPRMPHLLNAWPTFQALRREGLLPRDVRGMKAAEAIRGAVLSRSHRVLSPARAVATAWGLLLLALVYWSVARKEGPAIGVVAAGLLSLVPEFIAHSSIAGSDIPFTTLGFLAVVSLARYAERPGFTRGLAVAIAIGLAWSTRHTAILFLPITAALFLWKAISPTQTDDALDRTPHSRQSSPGDRLQPGTPRENAIDRDSSIFYRIIMSMISVAAIGAVAFLILWMGDGFQHLSVAKVAEHVTRFDIPRSIGPIDISNVPVPTSLVSLFKQVSHQAQGHEAYFLGEVGNRGWIRYFPIAMLIKTPLGLIGLLVLTAAIVRPKDSWDALLLITLSLLWITLLKSHVNIGLRYAMLTYPLVVPFVARLFTKRSLADRPKRLATIVAAAAFVWSSFAAQPRCVSYFNELVGGPQNGWIYLVDSNLDWGQDFDALTDALHELGIKEATIDVCTERALNRPSIFAIRFPHREAQIPAAVPPNRRLLSADGSYLPVYTRYVAVSATSLMGLYTQNDMSWLRSRKLVKRVNDSIFLFDMNSPADRPLYESEQAGRSEARNADDKRAALEPNDAVAIGG